MQKRSELFFNFLLLPIDFLAVVAGFVAAYGIRVRLDGRPLAYPVSGVLFLKVFLLVMPVWILIFAVNGLYNQTAMRGRINELGKIFAAVSGGTMFLILVDFLSKKPLFPAKSIPIYGYALGFLFVAIGRQIVRSIQRACFRYNVGVRRTVLVGSGPLAQRLAADMMTYQRSGQRIVAVIDEASGAAKRMKGFDIYRSLDEVLKDHPEIDEIVQADSALESEEILELINYASNHHLIYRFVPNQFGIYATHSHMTATAGIPMIEIRQTPLDGWGRIIKRTFDVIGATIATIIFAIPMFIIALAIKLTDPGPVFYRHKRLSRVGKEVYVYKFRSMLLKYSTGKGYSGKTDAEIFAEELGKPELAVEFKKEQKLENDPRVSRVGRILRKTSLVGPRPIVEEELEHYGDEISTFFALKPGVTGLWQISGRSDIGYEERVKLDIYYVENWSLWLDIKILAKTVVTVFTGRGAV
jgi:exopolysaccharide biosynthesis polyprenyl glycosylphosphotransferase